MALAAHSLTPADISDVARGIAAFPARPVHAAEAREQIVRTLGEHLERWHLVDLRQLARGERLEAQARPSGLVHHQIRHGRMPQQYAWSRVTPDGRRAVVGVFNSDLSQQVHAAVRWIDEKLETAADEPVRLLAFPVLRLHALWLVGEKTDRLVMIHDARARRHPEFKARTARQVLATLSRRLARVSPMVHQPVATRSDR